MSTPVNIVRIGLISCVFLPILFATRGSCIATASTCTYKVDDARIDDSISSHINVTSITSVMSNQ